jgi:hypothetical protein
MNDTPDPLETRLRGNLLTMRIIVGALIVGASALLIIATVKRMGDGQPRPPVVGLVGVAFVIGAPLAAAIVPNFTRRQWERQVAGGMWPGLPQSPHGPALPATPVEEVSEDDETIRWWGLYQTVLIIRCALLEGAAFLQGVAFMVEGNLFSVILGVVMVGMLLAQWPRREAIDRWVEERRETVERLRSEEMP